MILAVEKFINSDGSFSHYSVVQIDEETDQIVDLATCVMHETREEAERELEELQ